MRFDREREDQRFSRDEPQERLPLFVVPYWLEELFREAQAMGSRPDLNVGGRHTSGYNGRLLHKYFPDVGFGLHKASEPRVNNESMIVYICFRCRRESRIPHGRYVECIPCRQKRQSDYRDRHREAIRASDRERKRMKRKGDGESNGQ